ncbi:hypothetical protein [Desulfovibrio inopinatus]|uniref:hypothetical protein n=1 Tax=Desulfovibrio inopinatus TaxID=102109 RepID=UPI0004201DD1|nr:hypothetical protein [Desulfovibrio inopinatus]
MDMTGVWTSTEAYGHVAGDGFPVANPATLTIDVQQGRAFSGSLSTGPTESLQTIAFSGVIDFGDNGFYLIRTGEKNTNASFYSGRILSHDEIALTALTAGKNDMAMTYRFVRQGTSPDGETGGMGYIHFFVVPSAIPGENNVAKQITDLKKMLIKVAGGYTELGLTHGGSVKTDGNIELENNFSFVVTAKTDISQELSAFIKKHFKSKAPFIVTWPANVSIYGLMEASTPAKQ